MGPQKIAVAGSRRYLTGRAEVPPLQRRVRVPSANMRASPFNKRLGGPSMERLLLLGCASLALIAAIASAQARVTRIEITKQEPFAAGQTFATVGAYEKVVGRFRGELDPKSPLNAGIVDLDNAPRNARGMVEYSADFYILKPVDVTKGDGAL